MGYRAVGLAQTVLAAVLVISLPLWKMKPGNGKDRNETEAGQKNVREEKKIRGVEAAEEAGAERVPGLLDILRIPTVSYTHLDVYKRQGQCWWNVCPIWQPTRCTGRMWEWKAVQSSGRHRPESGS